MAGQSRTLSYQYDKNSNRTRVTHPDGQYFTYSYDGLNRQRELRENGSASLSDQLYNDQGQFVSNSRAPSVENHVQYDAAGRVSILDIRLNGTAQDNIFGFAYTPASQIKSRTTSNNLYANTAHYDVERSYTINGLNQYTQAGPAAFTYDANGNLTSDGSVNFTYDTENRLISASGVKNATLKYDPLGRLFEVAAPAGTTRFLYDGDALVGEYNSAGTMLHRYVHGNGVDQPLVWYDGGTVNSTNRRHLFANWQGSISAITDSAGTAVAVNAYDAYGIPNDINIGRFQYMRASLMFGEHHKTHSQILIPELGLYHYKARAYSPYLGRFLQTDPIGYDDQYNLYAYVGNDPVGNVDPTGLSQQEPEEKGNKYEATISLTGVLIMGAELELTASIDTSNLELGGEAELTGRAGLDAGLSLSGSRTASDGGAAENTTSADFVVEAQAGVFVAGTEVEVVGSEREGTTVTRATNPRVATPGRLKLGAGASVGVGGQITGTTSILSDMVSSAKNLKDQVADTLGNWICPQCP